MKAVRGLKPKQVEGEVTTPIPIDDSLKVMKATTEKLEDSVRRSGSFYRAPTAVAPTAVAPTAVPRPQLELQLQRPNDAPFSFEARTQASPTPTPSPGSGPEPQLKREHAEAALKAAKSASLLGSGAHDPDSGLAFLGDNALFLNGMTPETLRDLESSLQARLTPEQWGRVVARGPNILDRIGAGLEAITEIYGEAAARDAEAQRQANISAGKIVDSAGDAFLRSQKLQAESAQVQAESAQVQAEGLKDAILGVPATQEEIDRRINEILAERDRKQGNEVVDN